jgi:uncharacterized protein involved in exopolysaccharide biosynthesis
VDDADSLSGEGAPEFLRDPVGVLRRRWRWMVPVFLLGLIGTAVFVASMPVRYSATASVLVTSQRIPSDFVKTTVTDALLERMSALAAEVLTRERLASFVRKYDLYAGLKSSLTLEEITAKVLDDIRIQPQPAMGPRLRREESSAVLEVRVVADEAGTAAGIANEIAGLLSSEAMRTRTQQAELTTMFLRRELERAEAALREQERTITEYKSAHRGELPGDELQANLARLERLQQQRQSLALEIAEASTRVATVLSSADEDSEDPAARLQGLRDQLARERAVKTEAHPDVVALRSQLQALEVELERAPDEAPATARGGLVAAEMEMVKELRSQLAATDRAIRDLDARVAQTPLRQEELGAMDQKASVLREDYEEFLRKVREAELAESLERAQQGERVSLLNQAFAPSQPEKSRLKYLAAGLAASLAAAAAIGILLELLDPVLLSIRQVEESSELPVLGSVPRIS